MPSIATIPILIFVAIMLAFGALPAAAQAPCSVLSFPGAEGFGACASGGRGASVDKVFYVTSLADSGPHTLRWAAEEKSGKRIILFAQPGVIELESDLVIRNDDVTIIGLPYSPTITGASVWIKADNVVVRHLAFRLGRSQGAIGACDVADQSECESGADGWCNKECAKDTLFLKKVSDVMLDHLSLYWSTDEILSADSVENVTVSNTIIAEPLHWSLKHYENCKEDKSCPSTVHQNSSKWGKGHGRCQRWQGSRKVSVFRSLFMNCYERGFQTNSDGDYDSKIYLANNVFYDYYIHAFKWNDNDDGDRDAELVLQNNYLEARNTAALGGAAASFDPPGYNSPDAEAIVDIDKPKNNSQVDLWMTGNYTSSGFSSNCDLVERSDDDLDCRGWNNLPNWLTKMNSPTVLPAFPNRSNLAQYLGDVGRRPGGQLDNLDWSVVNAVLTSQNRRMVNEETQETVGTPIGHNLGCQSGSAEALRLDDWDCDGMTDAWEQSNGLSWQNPSDGNNDQDNDGYTNVEEWMFEFLAGLL